MGPHSPKKVIPVETNVRELKAHLSEVLRGVVAGETVIVNVHNRPVARIVPIGREPTLAELATGAGIRWNGRKPKGLALAEDMPVGVSVSDWVVEERR